MDREILYDLVKHVSVAVCLTVGGCFAINNGESEIAAACFGALAGYVIKNGQKVVHRD